MIDNEKNETRKNEKQTKEELLEKHALNDDDLEQVSGGQNDQIVCFGGISYFSHTVEKNDTLPRLAFRYNTNVQVLKDLNNINGDSNVLEQGRTILIPIVM